MARKIGIRSGVAYVVIACVLPSVAIIVIRALHAILPYGLPGTPLHRSLTGYRDSLIALAYLQGECSLFSSFPSGRSHFNSFAELCAAVRKARPETAVEPDAPNPFPALLPKGRRYGRLTMLPDGADPETTPFLWDLESGPAGQVLVLNWSGVSNGATRYPSMAALNAELDRLVREAGLPPDAIIIPENLGPGR